MHAHFDGFTTWRYSTCAGPGEARAAYVPQLGLQTAPGTATWDPSTPSWAPCTPPGPPRAALEVLKQRKIHVFYCVLRIAAGAVQSAPGALQEQPE